MPQRRKLGFTLAAVGALFAAVAGWYLLTNGTVSVAFSQAEVQAAINAKMPLVRSKGPLDYRVDSMQVQLRPDGRVGADLAVHAELAKRTADGTLYGSGQIVYRNGSFYLDGFDADPAAIKLAVSAADPEPSEHRLRDALKGKLTALLTKTGLDEEIKEWLTARREQIATKVKGLAVSAVGEVLERHPVYTLNQDNVKHNLARLTLKEVEVRDGALVVVLDPISGLLRLLAYAALVVVCGMAAVGLLLGLARGGGGLGTAVAVGSLLD